MFTVISYVHHYLMYLFFCFVGKQVYTCKTAADSFYSILATLGGPMEKDRAESLMANLTVVPDNPSFRTSRLPNTGKIKQRSKVKLYGLWFAIQTAPSVLFGIFSLTLKD